MIQPDRKSVKPERQQRLGRRGAQFGLDDQRRRAEDVDVALVELAEAPVGRPIGAPHRLNLVALEELRQLVRCSATTRASGTVRS